MAAREGAIETISRNLAAAEVKLGEREAELDVRARELFSRAKRVQELERIAARLAEQVAERDRELARVREELAEARRQGTESLRSLAALAEDLEEIRRQARSQATRMRMRALREAAELSERVGELATRPGDVRERVLESIQEAVRRIGGDGEEAESAVEPEVVEPRRSIATSAAANGHVEREADELFEGLIEVEVGPISDFSQLVGFEDAASGIAATSEISVKRFTQGRATLAMRLKEPVELLRELEERTPFEFKVRDTRTDRVVLDVDE